MKNHAQNQRSVHKDLLTKNKADIVWMIRFLFVYLQPFCDINQQEMK